MPPPSRVCTACKAAKKVCIGFGPGRTCTRCSRLRLNCVAAPHLRSMPRTQPFQAASLVATRAREQHGVVQTCSPYTRSHIEMLEWLLGDSCGRNLAHAHQLFVLRHIAVYARRCDDHPLLRRLIDACQILGHRMDTVLGSPVSDALGQASALIVDGTGSTPLIGSTSAQPVPLEIMHLVMSSPTCTMSHGFEREKPLLPPGWACPRLQRLHLYLNCLLLSLCRLYRSRLHQQPHVHCQPCLCERHLHGQQADVTSRA